MSLASWVVARYGASVIRHRNWLKFIVDGGRLFKYFKAWLVPKFLLSLQSGASSYMETLEFWEIFSRAHTNESTVLSPVWAQKARYTHLS